MQWNIQWNGSWTFGWSEYEKNHINDIFCSIKLSNERVKMFNMSHFVPIHHDMVTSVDQDGWLWQLDLQADGPNPKPCTLPGKTQADQNGQCGLLCAARALGIKRSTHHEEGVSSPKAPPAWGAIWLLRHLTVDCNGWGGGFAHHTAADVVCDGRSSHRNGGDGSSCR